MTQIGAIEWLNAGLLCSKTADGSYMKHFPENLVTSDNSYFDFYNLNSVRSPVR